MILNSLKRFSKRPSSLVIGALICFISSLYFCFMFLTLKSQYVGEHVAGPVTQLFFEYTHFCQYLLTLIVPLTSSMYYHELERWNMFDLIYTSKVNTLSFFISSFFSILLNSMFLSFFMIIPFTLGIYYSQGLHITFSFISLFYLMIFFVSASSFLSYVFRKSFVASFSCSFAFLNLIYFSDGLLKYVKNGVLHRFVEYLSLSYQSFYLKNAVVYSYNVIYLLSAVVLFVCLTLAFFEWEKSQR